MNQKIELVNLTTNNMSNFRCESDVILSPGYFLAVEFMKKCSFLHRYPILKIKSSLTESSQYLDSVVNNGKSKLWINLASHSGISLKELSFFAKDFLLTSSCAELIYFPQIDLNKHKILILAPHPDDPEVSSYSIYTSYPQSTVIVTITDGLNTANRNFILTSQRVIESLTIPQFNGISFRNTINLAYPDGNLKILYENYRTSPMDKKSSRFNEYRNLNVSPYMPTNSIGPCWISLINDLVQIIQSYKPTIIITPHPLIDSHFDHVFTTLALDEALQICDYFPSAILTTFVHNKITELYPFGPHNSEISLPPFPQHFNNIQLFDSVQVAFCSEDLNHLKFRAMEAHSDLRTIRFPIYPTFSSAFLQLKIAAYNSLLFHPNSPPNSLFRRFIRPHELFLTITSSATFQNICQHAKN
ncbi:MAG: PIG-L family deacetylase [Methylacidiphilales bacterium]|nr:PIG-L family deacetylase [Candidatus Methylacidiphilales bacterium]